MIENPRDCWSTPSYVFLYWQYAQGFKFTLDAAANEHNAMCQQYNTATEPYYQWSTNVVWCNPPYSDISPWVSQFMACCDRGVMLLPARTDSAWFHNVLKDDDISIWFVEGRIQFVPPPDIKASSNREGSLFLVKGLENFVKIASISLDEMRNAL